MLQSFTQTILVAVICTAALVPQFFLPAKPPTPTSRFERRQQTGENNKISVLQSTIGLVKNIHFWILCGIHGLNVGLSIAWGGLMNQAITPYGYSDSQAGNIVAVGIFAGTLGCRKSSIHVIFLIRRVSLTESPSDRGTDAGFDETA